MIFGSFIALVLYIVSEVHSQTTTTANPSARSHVYETLLIDNLFLNYSLSKAYPLIRPATADGAVKVNLGYDSIVLKNVDDRTGEITLGYYESRMWTDDRLSWDSAKYGGVTKISVPPHLIWLPDFQHAQHKGGSVQMDDHPLYGIKAIIYSNGHVVYVPKRETTFQCRFNVEWFPFDTQFCNMSIMSWIHPKEEVEAVIHSDANPVVSLDHADWKVKDIRVAHYDTKYPCCPETYQTVTVHMTMERKPGFYFYILCAPSAMITAILPFLHFFPPASSQKSIIAGLMLVMSFILHAILYDVLQNFAMDNVPKLILHYDIQMVMTVVSIVVSAITASLANTKHTRCRVPYVIRKCLGVVLGRLCCFGDPDVKGEFAQLGQNVQYDRHHDMAPIVTEGHHDGEHQGHNITEPSSLDILNEELRQYRVKQQMDREWYQLAIILDRVTAIVYILFVIIYTAGVESHKSSNN